MDKEEITNWLKSVGKDRHWLAEQINCTYGTLTQYFSKGFPEWAIKAIKRLATPQETNTAGLEVIFTAAEFELIEKARSLSGHPTRAEFYRDSILEFAQHIMVREQSLEEPKPPKRKTKIIHLPGSVSQKAAEDPNSYKQK